MTWFFCPVCGRDSEWTPDQLILACPTCETELIRGQRTIPRKLGEAPLCDEVDIADRRDLKEGQQ